LHNIKVNWRWKLLDECWRLRPRTNSKHAGNKRFANILLKVTNLTMN
jgi:hypothetical protein